MHHARTLAISAALTLALGGSARAGTLVTAPFLVDTTQRITCIVLNEGKKPARNVVFEVVRYNVPPPATVAATDNIVELLPLQYVSAGYTNEDVTSVFVCRFTFAGSGKWLRASGLVREAGGAVLETHPAR